MSKDWVAIHIINQRRSIAKRKELNEKMKACVDDVPHIFRMELSFNGLVRKAICTKCGISKRVVSDPRWEDKKHRDKEVRPGYL
jgi:hypothetical protein